jgi:hypothetical protein
MDQINPQKPDDAYWQDVKNIGLAAFSAAIGDPEAMKTVVDVLTNATVKGLEHLNLKDTQKEEIKKKFAKSMNLGADGIMSALSKFQKASMESNIKVREKYGRKRP